MGGDHYTQIHNYVFRDSRLSGKAMGVFGHISTHDPDQWDLTVESIARSMRDGVDAIKGALRELERYHYLIRGRERTADGKLAGAVYFYTDLPAQLLALEITDAEIIAARVQREFDTWQNQQTRRSEPKRDFPPQANPTQVNPATQKTNYKKTKTTEHQPGGAPPPDPPGHRPATPIGTADTGAVRAESPTVLELVSDHLSPRARAVDALAAALSRDDPQLTHQAAIVRAFRILAGAIPDPRRATPPPTAADHHPTAAATA